MQPWYCKNITQNIISKTELLDKSPFIGQVEDLLIHLKKDYRYLVSGNYKIIYLVKPESVEIINVYDTRQDPIKIEEFK